MIDQETQDRWDLEDAARDARLGAPGALLRAALYYAQQGIAVFPLKPGTKVPDCRNGFKDATTDQQRVRNWWAAGPDRNIGLPTGLLFDVIDVDGPEGYLSLLDVDLPDVIGKAYTPSGGRHLFITPTGDGNAARELPGVDYRGAGGYVVAPPSLIDKPHNPDRPYEGRRYAWVMPLELG